MCFSTVNFDTSIPSIIGTSSRTFVERRARFVVWGSANILPRRVFAALGAVDLMDDSLSRVAHAARLRFRGKFHRKPTVIAAAPGRVNVIGEHTDYNDGFVLPMAIERHIVIAAVRSENPKVRMFSAQSGEEAILRIGMNREEVPRWARYVLGVLELSRQAGLVAGGFDAVIDSSLPPGAGLSSSAALEAATLGLIEALSGKGLGPLEKARLCQRAEHEYAGVPCGLMDQAASIMAKRDHLMLLDCRSLDVRQIPFRDPGVGFLVANSKVKHQLGDGEYARRREECRAAAKLLGVASLRDATMDSVRGAGLILRRARHVITENARTIDLAAAVERGDFAAAGALMNESHVSLRDDYEVSCAELDLLAEISWKIGIRGGVYGCRMTGAGFGGSTVSLIDLKKAGEIMESVRVSYREIFGIEPDQFVARPAGGAALVRGDSE